MAAEDTRRPAEPPCCDPGDLSPERQRALLVSMLRIRAFEEAITAVYPAQDMRSPVHLSVGQEAVAAGVCAAMRPGDYLASTHRCHGHLLAVGADPGALLAECYGKADGCCRGRGGSMHLADPDHGVLGTSAILGGGIPIATGYGLALRLTGSAAVSVCFFGDGASEEGSFYESLNFAALKKLPVVYVCENNFYAVNSPQQARQPHPDIHRRADALGVAAELVDGNDVFAVNRAARAAIDRARSGLGPTCLECRTYRWRGHVGPECDCDKGCRPREELAAWQARCPVDGCLASLRRRGALDEAWLAAVRREVAAEIDAAMAFARQSPFPDPGELPRHVFAGAGGND